AHATPGRRAHAAARSRAHAAHRREARPEGYVRGREDDADPEARSELPPGFDAEDRPGRRPAGHAEARGRDPEAAAGEAAAAKPEVGGQLACASAFSTNASSSRTT